MGSKKHKKESKKKKHRSRSRSPLDGGEERERKRHKKHKDRKRDRSPDIEEVPVDSHLKPVDDLSLSPSRSSSPEREVEPESERDRERRQRDLAQAAKRKDSAPDKIDIVEAGSSGRAQESLSIDETNRLRAKLGLKPLQVAETAPAEDGKITDDLGEFYHKPAANIAEQKRAEKLREKLDERREKRKMENKLKTTLLTADVSDDEDAMAWVKKSRELQKQKQEAAKRAAMLDEMDEVFGVSALVQEESREDQREAGYGSSDVEKLRVLHDYSMLEEERDIVLTLADKPVLGEDTEDVLMNVNIADDERARKNIEERKKAKKGYKAYDQDEDYEALALGYQKPVLAKYDDEIDPEATHRKKGFRLGDTDAIEASRFRDMMRQEQLAGGPNKRLESLILPPLKPANDFYTAQEMDTKFKKIKRKGKSRRRVKQEGADEEQLHTDDTAYGGAEGAEGAEGAGGAAGWLATDELETEPDVELQAAIARALRARHRTQHEMEIEEIKPEVVEQLPSELECEGGMVLDATAEFCRQLGDIPTYGLAPNRHLDLPNDELEMPVEGEEEGEKYEGGAWSRVDTSVEHPPHEIKTEVGAGLEAEPALGGGVAGALRLALSKGYLQREHTAAAHGAAADHPLAAAAYTIEDKTHIDDEKDRRRERSSHGALHEFREKSNFRPSVKLEYVDDDGRPLCPKEAFRYLSHKFHGKGPGKNKHEKRIKKAVQEGLMKKMSSTDTPLNTLQLLQDKQRETGSAHVILSGQRKPN